MQTLLVVAELIIAIALVIFVLLQRSEGGGLGMGSGGGNMGGLFSARGAADALTRTTAILATLFFLVCIGLNLAARQSSGQKSILEAAPASQAPAKTAPLKPSPFAPSVPKPQ